MRAPKRGERREVRSGTVPGRRTIDRVAVGQPRGREMMKSILLVLGIAMATVLAFPSIAGAQEDSESVEADTPYIDEYGNFDNEMAKEYADLVDSYVDEFGTEWDVWLDDVGFKIWAVSEGDAYTDDIIEILFYPVWVRVYRQGLTTAQYTRSFTAAGIIKYEESCGTRCQQWLLCSRSSYAPTDVTRVEAEGYTDDDYCDGNFDTQYAPPPDHDWEGTDSNDCWQFFGDWYYTLDDDDPDGDDDYQAGAKMVRFDYHVDGLHYSTRIVYQGTCIE